MSFLSPIWLVGVVPWVILSVWLLWGRRRLTDVPFVDLWRGPVTGPRARRAMQAPPVALVLMLLAILLAILAAGRPVVALRELAREPIDIIVDRGITMSAKGRLDESVYETVAAVSESFSPIVPVELMVVPGSSRRTDISDIPGLVGSATALDTSAILRQAVRSRLARSADPVIVLSDQPLGITDERLVQVAPVGSVANVGIVRVAARVTPFAQVMVRVRNQSQQTEATLRVRTGGGAEVERVIELPERGEERDYFVDVGGGGDGGGKSGSALRSEPAWGGGSVVAVELGVQDELDADNRAWLARERTWPRVEVRATVSPELMRMVQVYGRQRPSGEGSQVVVVANDPDVLGDQRGVAVSGDPHPNPLPRGEGVDVADHPLTRHVDWLTVAEGASLAQVGPAGGGWRPVVRRGEQMLVAVRETPARQVWVGFGSEQWPRTPDYVAFWANVFDWLGEGGESFVSHPVGPLDAQWQLEEPQRRELGVDNGLLPGVYRHRGDGTLRAVNALDVSIAPPSSLPTDWRDSLASLARRSRTGLDLASWLLLAALGCAALSAGVWARSGRVLTVSGPARTVGP